MSLNRQKHHQCWPSHQNRSKTAFLRAKLAARPMGLGASYSSIDSTRSASHRPSKVKAKGAGRTEYLWLPTDDASAIPVGMSRSGKLFAIHSGGWDKQAATAAKYNKRQQDFRSGTGVMLNLSPQQEAVLASCMRASTAAYSAVTNNCSSPVQQCLNAAGAGVDYSMLPSSILENLRSSRSSNGSVSYRSPRPGRSLGVVC